MSGGYLLNGFGRGSLWEPDDPDYGALSGEEVTDFVLGFNFTDENGDLRDAEVESLDIGYASGSNLPTSEVKIVGYRDNDGDGFDRRPSNTSDDYVWHATVNVGYGAATTVTFPEDAVNRVEIYRTEYDPPSCPSFQCPDGPFGWYVLDNIKFDTAGYSANDAGQYRWETQSRSVYIGAAGFVPLPAAIWPGLLLMGGLVISRSAPRKR